MYVHTIINNNFDLFQNFYGEKFGKDNVIIIKDSKTVEVWMVKEMLLLTVFH